MSPEEIVGIYVRAWSEPDATHRGHLLQQCWTDDGTYCDPRVQWRGREALNTGISDFQQRLPGTTFRLTGPIEVHHDVLRFRWSMHRADGSVALIGTDFGELAEDGRLRRITGFFNQAGAAPIVMGDDEFILYIRKQYRDCGIPNPRLGRLIWERLRELDPTAEKVRERPVRCEWGDTGSFIGERQLPGTATQFRLDRVVLPRLYDYLDELGRQQ